MTAQIQIPIEQVVQLFERLYPTEFRHCVAEARAAILEQRLAELDALDPTDDSPEATD